MILGKLMVFMCTVPVPAELVSQLAGTVGCRYSSKKAAVIPRDKKGLLVLVAIFAEPRISNCGNQKKSANKVVPKFGNKYGGLGMWRVHFQY